MAFPQPPRRPDGTGGGNNNNRPRPRLNFGQFSTNPNDPGNNGAGRLGRPPGMAGNGSGHHGYTSSSQQRPPLRLNIGGLNLNANPQHHPRPQQQQQQPSQTQMLFCRDRIRSRNLESVGILTISPDQTYDFSADDLEDRELIGQGNFGSVIKMYHKASNTIMAVKRIRSTVDEKDQKQLLMDLDVVKRSSHCQYIIKFYGALFKEGDCWICMELMDASLDKFYKFIFDKLKQRFPEEILGKVTVATLKALNYLKDELKIIHRDVKPSNILVDREGNIKMCDFGISGQLVDSIAKTQDAGCRPYMAPERIDPSASRQGYDVRSDVWSLGITLSELANGSFPFRKWNSVFEQLAQVVKGEPPRIVSTPELPFSSDFVDFVSQCLTKDDKNRPKYRKLLDHPFILRSQDEEVDVALYVCSILDKMDESKDLIQV